MLDPDDLTIMYNEAQAPSDSDISFSIVIQTDNDDEFEGLHSFELLFPTNDGLSLTPVGIETTTIIISDKNGVKYIIRINFIMS